MKNAANAAVIAANETAGGRAGRDRLAVLRTAVVIMVVLRFQ
jgi:hypothetical protein